MRVKDVLLGAALGGVAHLVVSCGGTTIKGSGEGASSSGGSASGSGSSTGASGVGASSPGTGAGPSMPGTGGKVSAGGRPAMGGAPSEPVPTGCEAMDAKPSGNQCARTAGYRFNGQLCEGITCECVGSDCDIAFATMEECDRAFNYCYTDRGFARHCTEHSDCALYQRTCCPACGVPAADDYIALRSGSLPPPLAMVCLGQPGAGCPECGSTPSPAVYAACSNGQCGVVDVTEHAACDEPSDCSIVTKDCCDCGGDFSPSGVMAVGPSFVRPERCDGVGCDGCIPPKPGNVVASCHPDLALCSALQIAAQ